MLRNVGHYSSSDMYHVPENLSLHATSYCLCIQKLKRMIFVSIYNSRRCNFLSTKWKWLGRNVRAIQFFFVCLRHWHFEMTAELATHVCSYYFHWVSCYSSTHTHAYAGVPNTVAALPDCSFYWRNSVEYRSSLTSMFRFSTFVIVFFYTNASTFRDWFLRTGMRPRCQWVGHPHSPATAQITLSSVNLCISAIYVDCILRSCCRAES
jgi:hypothetical protein